MVKQLHDICLNFIQCNLNHIPNISDQLPTVHKELLLERIADHDLLCPDYIPCVKKQLVCSSIRHITFHKCDQVTDDVLVAIANQKCMLDSVVINKCPSVTGRNTYNVHQLQVGIHTISKLK